MSYVISGNTSILGHIYELRLHCSSRKIIKPPCLLLTRVLKKKKACQYSQMLSHFKIINSVFLTTVEQLYQYRLYCPSSQFPSVFNKEIWTFSWRPKPNLYHDVPELLHPMISYRCPTQQVANSNSPAI